MLKPSMRKILPFIVFALMLQPAPVAQGYSQASAVLLVIDGLGADYVYPQASPLALDGSPLDTPVPWNPGFRVENVTAPVPRTGPGHAVLFTGYSGAETEHVGYNNCTIFDLARNEGYLCVAVLERGDTQEVLLANDAAVHDAKNSIHRPELLVVSRPGIPAYVTGMLREFTKNMGPMLDGLEGTRRYAAYNRWAISCTIELVSELSTRGVPFLLTVNAGCVDSAGHYLGPDGYASVIDALREDVQRLIDACASAGVFLVITADHGMAFPDTDSRGGHASSRYSGANETRRIPFFILGPGIEEGVLEGYYGQQDIAPTLLELMGVERRLPLADGCSVFSGCPPPDEIRGIDFPAKTNTPVMLAGCAVLVAINVAGLGYIYRLYRGR